MNLRLPLFHDRLASREKRAAVELTEADLRILSLAASAAAVNPPPGWNTDEDIQNFIGLGNRLKRVADELRKADLQEGAAPIAVGPRHGSKELSR